MCVATVCVCAVCVCVCTCVNQHACANKKPKISPLKEEPKTREIKDLVVDSIIIKYKAFT